MQYKEKIIDYCTSLGIDIIGFSQCRIFNELRPYFEERKEKELENEFEEKLIENRINPFLQMEDGRTIISIAFPYLYASSNNEDGFSRYTLGMDYHKVVSMYLEKICAFIEDLGGKAKHFVDSNSLPERYIAYQSGIGFIGKNNMLITEKYGSFVFLGEIITNLLIEKDEPKQSKCGECEACLVKCPTKSINNKESCPNICLSYITQCKDIKDTWFEKLDGRLFGCDSCQIICPFNKDVQLSQIKEFIPYDFMKDVNLDEIININNKVYKEKFKVTSCGWRGKNILQRNALINSVLKLNKTIDINKINSPYIKDYYKRILSIKNNE